VLVPGAKAPTLISNALVSRMRFGSVLVDIAIDQGGCFEDSRPTTHAEPTFRVHNSVFYCVANMPGAGAEHLDVRADRTSRCRTRSALPIAAGETHSKADPALALGLNTYDGKITNGPVRQAHELEHRELADVLG
jgi:alanine dehydrogenase